MKSHSDFLFGEGVLAEAVYSLEMEAAHAGTAAAWTEAYHAIHGIDRLWGVYRQRLHGNTGLTETLAINNSLSRLMRGMDEYEPPYAYFKGEAAKYRKTTQDAYNKAVATLRKRQDAA